MNSHPIVSFASIEDKSLKDRSSRNALRSALTYATLATAWILLSDQVVELVTGNSSAVTSYQTLKGLGFVTVTAALLFLILRRQFGNLQRDIARRQQVEAALRASQAHLEQAQAIAHLGSWERDLEKDTLEWSQETRRMFAWDAGAEVSYAAFMSRVHPQDVVRLRHAQEAAMAAAAPLNLEYRIIRPSGEVRTLHEQGETSFAADGRPLRLAGAVLDITERRQAERDLRFTRFSVDKAADAVFWVDAGAQVLYANEAATRMFGYAPEESVQRTLHDLNPEWRTEHWATLWQRLKAEGAVLQETTLRHKDGSTIEVEVSANFLQFEDHEFGVYFARDITARKRAEAEVRRLNLELEQRVQERTAQLRAANKELEAFAYSVSHDLKAPLRGIEGYSRLLLEDYAASLEGDARQFLYNIRQGARQMAELIDDLLSYSRLERSAVAVTAVDLQALISGLVAERADEIRQREIDVNMRVACLTISADASGLTLALRNLLDNALKFTRDIARPAIEIGARRLEEGSCLLWVRDNGPGFDMQYQERMFEIFQRLPTAQDYPGTGIGLAMVRKAMQRMGGRAWVESAPGAGATFYLEIPVA